MVATIDEVKRLDFTNFESQAVEKVRWLLVILDRINAHPFLKPRVSLHGGTAINLFFLDLPRLSVDADINYIGSTDRTTMLKERPQIEQSIRDVGKELDLKVSEGEPEHAGRSFKLHYSGDHGTDFVKIDLDYLNRSPLLPLSTGRVSFGESGLVEFSINSGIELIGGKIKALLGRVVPRDLYDICQISDVFQTLVSQNDETLYRRILLYFSMVSSPFPRPFEVANRFKGRERDVEEVLYPMLAGNVRPNLEDMIDKADTFISDVTTPRSDSETEFLAKAAKGEFCPELLFADYPNVLTAADHDPTALWKMRNLEINIIHCSQ